MTPTVSQMKGISTEYSKAGVGTANTSKNA